MHPRYRQSCRVCGSLKLRPVIDLGDQYLQGSFVKAGTLLPPMRKLPTQLVRCDLTENENGCGLVQMKHSFPPEILYANYWYRSATNATMRNHLAGIVQSALTIVSKSNPVVLDIGCNDGTLLRNYGPDATRYGVDPSDIASDLGDLATVVNTVFPSDRATAILPEGGFDIVTSIAMFYDLEDPVKFARSISRLLKKDGIWIFEMSYLPLMLLQNSFDTICHEHLEYYSLAVLEQIAKRADMRIFRAEINDINGGSIRCYASTASNDTFGTAEDRLLMHRLRSREFEMELDTQKPYLDFQERIEKLKDQLNNLLFDIRARGERVHIYGASTKGNVLLQWYGINRVTVDCAADRNEQKVGSFTLGTNIPIVSEEKSRAMKPDYYLVLPWHFKAEFLERERAAIMAGTKMIFPLPEVAVVTADNLDASIATAARETDHLVQILLNSTARD